MKTKLSTLLRAGGALAALLAITLGVPWALARAAGWPLPTTWPHLDRLPDVLRDGLSDGFWIKAIALVVWLAWAQVIIAVGAEVVARVRGRSSDRRQGLGWAQALAGHLVGALAVAGGFVGSAPHAIAAPAPSLASTLVAVAGPLPAAPSTMAPIAVAAPVQHVVVRGESLSSIARDELGQAAAWPTLWEANQGRVFGERVFDDPNLILPGWDLAVPQPAVLIPPLVLSAADEHVPAGPMPVVAPPTTSPAPDSAVAAPETTPATALVAGDEAAPATSAAPAAPAAPADDGGMPAWTQLGVLLGATLLATGAAGMIASARRRSLRASATTSTVVTPEPEVAEVVTALHAGSDALAMARLELALRSLAGQLARTGSEAQPLAVRRRDEVLEVVLDRVAALSAPWVPGRGDRTWELPAAVTLTDLTDDARAVAPPCPALVGVGRDGDGHEVYVDLEAVGSVRVDADASRLVAATLAVTPLADSLQVLVVGDDLVPLPSGRHEVRHLTDVAAAVGEADALTSTIAQAGAPSTFRLRSVAGHETWEPVIVVLTCLVADDEAAELRSLAAARRGVVVVGMELPDAGLDLVPGDDGWVRVAGWSVWPHGLDRRVAEAVAAAVDAPVVVEEAPRDEAAADDRPCDDAPSDDVRQPWTLMVRVLGPVDVVDAEGRQAEFERAKALELVTWLAQHPQSATRAGARAALWAIDVSNASFSNVVSEARRALARLASPPDGADWVARTYAERLPLHSEVVLDAELVRRHLERARRLPDTEAIAELRQALELVRGAPYAGRSYLWPDAEALPSTLTLLVTTVAAELGRRLLDAGDLDGVFAATAVGLDVLPGHEELIALRLRAHAQRGDRSALHREYMSYEHAVLADPWDGEPSPTLVALRRELLQPVAGD